LQLPTSVLSFKQIEGADAYRMPWPQADGALRLDR
jgi:hypothetical protein